MEAVPGVASYRKRLVSSKTLLARAERAVLGAARPVPSRQRPSARPGAGMCNSLPLASAMLFSSSRGMCLLCRSPPLPHREQPVPAWQGMFLRKVFYLIPTT